MVIIKAAIGLISAVSAVGVYRLNKLKAYESRANLIKQLEEALEGCKKYSATELFRMLHGVRLTYEEVRTLTKKDKVAHILHVLTRTPSMVSYTNGEFKYSISFSKPFNRIIYKYSSRFCVAIFGVSTFAFIVMFALSEGTQAIAILFLLIPSSAFLTMQLNEIKYDKFVEELVDQKTI